MLRSEGVQEPVQRKFCSKLGGKKGFLTIRRVKKKKKDCKASCQRKKEECCPMEKRGGKKSPFQKSIVPVGGKKIAPYYCKEI